MTISFFFGFLCSHSTRYFFGLPSVNTIAFLFSFLIFFTASFENKDVPCLIPASRFVPPSALKSSIASNAAFLPLTEETSVQFNLTSTSLSKSTTAK